MTSPESEAVQSDSSVASNCGSGGKKVALAVKGIVSGAILAALYSKFKAQLPPLNSNDLIAILPASVILLLQPIMIGARWQQILRIYSVQRGFVLLTQITWISVFANQFLPAGIGGDAIRVVFARRAGVHFGTALATVFIDRIIALIALALLVAFFAPTLGEIVDWRVLVFIGASCGVGIVAVYFASRWLRAHAGARVARWPILVRLLGSLNYILFVLTDPMRSSLALLSAASVHGLSATAFVLVARGLGIDVPWLDLAAIALVLTFVQIVPISIGGWGLREAASVGLFAGFGVDGGHAVLASLFLGIAYLVASLPGAVLWPFRLQPGAAAK